MKEARVSFSVENEPETWMGTKGHVLEIIHKAYFQAGHLTAISGTASYVSYSYALAKGHRSKGIVRCDYWLGGHFTRFPC